jgi:hypothetical protein
MVSCRFSLDLPLFFTLGPSFKGHGSDLWFSSNKMALFCWTQDLGSSSKLALSYSRYTLYHVMEWAPSHFGKHSVFRNVPYFFPLIPGTHPTGITGIFIFYFILFLFLLLLLLYFIFKNYMVLWTGCEHYLPQSTPLGPPLI